MTATWKQWVLATHNVKKGLEMKAIFQEIAPGVTLLTGRDLALGEPVEDGESFRENALIKARFAYEKTGLPSLADDSGLAVDALGGAPGVYSARYAGEGATDAENNAKLLAAMQGVPEAERGAAYHAVIALVVPYRAGPRPEGFGEIATARGRALALTVAGRCQGWVMEAPQGDGGFGYDPVMRVDGMSRRFAELSAEEKNAISHRGQALTKLTPVLKALIGS